jgi:hypothetical protein
MPGFLIFKNNDSSYPIRNVPDDVPYITYCSTPSGFNNGKLFVDWLFNPRFWGVASRNQPKRHLFVDNVGSHLLAIEKAKANALLNTEIIPLVENATHIMQPADQFPIKIVKSIYREYWDEYILSAIEDKLFQQKILEDGSLNGSGKIRNPGKYFILKLMGKVLKEANSKTDANGMNFARKSMIGCSLSLNVEGKWSIDMLFPKLRKIVQENYAYFEGELVAPGMQEEDLESSALDDEANEEEEEDDEMASDAHEEQASGLDEYGLQHDDLVIDENDIDEEALDADLVCHENLNSEEGDDPLFLYDENVDGDDDDIVEVHHIRDDVVERPPIRSASIRARHRLVRGVDSEMDKLLDAFLNLDVYNDSVSFDY